MLIRRRRRYDGRAARNQSNRHVRFGDDARRKRSHVYRPDDLIEIFGDVDVDSLMTRMECENGASHGMLDVRAFSPVGSEAVGLRIRRLAAIKIKRVPVWREE